MAMTRKKWDAVHSKLDKWERGWAKQLFLTFTLMLGGGFVSIFFIWFLILILDWGWASAAIPYLAIVTAVGAVGTLILGIPKGLFWFFFMRWVKRNPR